MTLKDRMTADVTVYLNSREFADAAVYNGHAITVVPEIGPDAQAGNTFTGGGERDGQTDRATFWVSSIDVPEPIQGDRIAHNGTEWIVARVLESGGGMHKLQCTSREAVGWR